MVIKHWRCGALAKHVSAQGLHTRHIVVSRSLETSVTRLMADGRAA